MSRAKGDPYEARPVPPDNEKIRDYTYKLSLLSELPERAGVQWTGTVGLVEVLTKIPAHLVQRLDMAVMWEAEDVVCEEIIDWIRNFYPGKLGERSKRLCDYQSRLGIDK